jgi:hypothetical protein
MVRPSEKSCSQRETNCEVELMCAAQRREMTTSANIQKVNDGGEDGGSKVLNASQIF